MRWDDAKPLGEHEYPEPDEHDDDDEYVVDCPSCGSEIYEDVEQCPYCQQYITVSSDAWSGRPAWWIVLGIIGIVITILALMSV